MMVFLSTCFLGASFLRVEDAGSRLHQNGDTLLLNYTLSVPRRLSDCSKISPWMNEHTFETVTMLMAGPLEYGDAFGTCRPSFVILIAHSMVSPFL
jgi:hypothetical protein